MPQKNALSNTLYLLPYQLYIKAKEESETEIASEAKKAEAKTENIDLKIMEIEDEYKNREKLIKAEYQVALDRLKRKGQFYERRILSLECQTKISKNETEMNDVIGNFLLGEAEEPTDNSQWWEKNEINKHLISFKNIDEECLLINDYALLSYCNANYPEVVAYIKTDILNDTGPENYIETLPVIHKNILIDCLRFRKVIKIRNPSSIKRKDNFVIFGHYTWSLNEKDLALKDDNLSLLMLENIDNERRKFERLKNKYCNTPNTVQNNKRIKIPEDVRIFVWRRDQGKCVACGSNENLEFDHIIPVSKGGSSTARNVQLLCEPCNRSKSNNI